MNASDPDIRKEELVITTTVETRTITNDHGVIPQTVPGITVLCPPVVSFKIYYAIKTLKVELN
jgi:hypothetical protein